MKQAQVDFQEISSQGWALGVKVIVATQHPIAEHLGEYGSTLLANLGARIGVGGLEPSGAGALFAIARYDRLPNHNLNFERAAKPFDALCDLRLSDDPGRSFPTVAPVAGVDHQD
jgi:hypothetical protein